jgi:hypothetical protein
MAPEPTAAQLSTAPASVQVRRAADGFADALALVARRWTRAHTPTPSWLDWEIKHRIQCAERRRVLKLIFIGGSRRAPAPRSNVTSAAGSSRARFGNECVHSANAAGLGWNIPCPWHGHSCRARRRLRDATSLRIRDVPPPCYDRLSWCFLIVGRRMSATPQLSFNSGRTKCARCLCSVVLTTGLPKGRSAADRMTRAKFARPRKIVGSAVGLSSRPQRTYVFYPSTALRTVLQGQEELD